MSKIEKKIKKDKPKCARTRNWALSDFELLDWESIFETKKDVIRYIIFGKEICPKTKKLHYQVFIQFVNAKAMGGVKRTVGSKKIHCEKCWADEKSNVRYCSKDGDFKELGQWKTMGGRTDLEHIKKMCLDQEDDLQIANTHFGSFIRYHTGIAKYKQLVNKEKTKSFRKVEVILIKGPTNTNKTRTAMKDATFKIQGSQLQWWDGYNQEKTICIDEYSNDVKITNLLSLLDGYQLRLPIKGAFTYANWTKVYITTNLMELHTQAIEEHQDALMRRITSVINKF